MSENGEKCWSVFLKSQDDVLIFLVLSTTQRYLVHCQKGGKKPEHLHIEEVGIKEMCTYFLIYYENIR